jgi:hypothetical protein
MLQTEIGEVKNILQTEIAEVKTELRAEIAEVKSDVKLLRWMVGFNLALTVAVAVLWLLLRGGT